VAFRRLVEDLSTTSAVVFSSHLLAEVSAVCHRVVVLDAGRITLDRDWHLEDVAAGVEELEAAFLASVGGE
jgi:ABC-type Na+ transport system ATPase subunit NatA